MFRHHGTSARIAAPAILAVVFWIGPGAAAPASAPSLTVTGLIHTPLALTAADLAAMPRTTLSISDDNGNKAVYDGVPVQEILKRAGAPSGKELRGPNMALGVVARASDGYRVLFSLAEFDPAFHEATILLADRRDNKPLDSREGPLRLVVPGEKRHARWVRGITDLQVFQAR